MNTLSQVLGHILLVFVDMKIGLILLRAILSWFFDETSGILQFLYAVTEPLIGPMRWLISKSETLSSLPIDMALFFTQIVLVILSTLLGLWF